MKQILVLSCEHGGNVIPRPYLDLFSGAEEILNSHRGLDLGALNLFRKLSPLADFSLDHTISRLLVEANRSLHNSQLFSEFTQELPKAQKEEILNKFYFPYRQCIEQRIGEYIKAGCEVIHLSIHTFTPQLSGKIRTAELGLLFDPARKNEEAFCERFQKELLIQDENLQVKFNYPYKGIDDGFTTYLRTRFLENYAGIELEVNQKFVKNNRMKKGFKNVIFEALFSSFSE